MAHCKEAKLLGEQYNRKGHEAGLKKVEVLVRMKMVG